MSWSGPREVKEPAPPNRKPGGKTLTKTGKKIKEKAKEKKIKQHVKYMIGDTKYKKFEGKTLKEIAIEDNLLALKYFPGYLDKKALEKIALKEPKIAFDFSRGQLSQELREKVYAKLFQKSKLELAIKNNEQLSKETWKKYSLEDPKYALKHMVKKLNKDFILNKLIPKANPRDIPDKVKILFPEICTSDKELKDIFINVWKADPSNEISIYFRNLASKEFGLKNVDNWDLNTNFKPNDQKKLKKVLRSIYVETQTKLKEKYPKKTTLKVYRGIASKVDIPAPFNSFTGLEWIAKEFSEGFEVLHIDVPIKNILFSPESTHAEDNEYIVLGNYNEF